MKISKSQLKEIIREEKSQIYELLDFGSNFERQKQLKESSQNEGNFESILAMTNVHLPFVVRMMEAWEPEAYSNRPDPRAEDIYELLFQLEERLMAIKENRE